MSDEQKPTTSKKNVSEASIPKSWREPAAQVEWQPDEGDITNPLREIAARYTAQLKGIYWGMCSKSWPHNLIPESRIQRLSAFYINASLTIEMLADGNNCEVTWSTPKPDSN
jgi:hypothetical protein